MSVAVEKRKLKSPLLVGPDIGPIEPRLLEDRVELFEGLLFGLFKIPPELWTKFKGDIVPSTWKSVEVLGERLGFSLGCVVSMMEKRRREGIIPYKRTYLRRKLEEFYEEFKRFGEGGEIHQNTLRGMVLRLCGHDSRTYERWLKLLDSLGAVGYGGSNTFHVYPSMLRVQLGIEEDEQSQQGDTDGHERV